MNLLHLDYFCKLAEKEHYGKTAESLYISQSNLSYAISALEKELGIKLFTRNGRNVVLNAKGKIFYEYARQALSLINEGAEKITANINLPIETVHLGVRRVWFLISILGDLSAQEKNKNIRITYAQCNDTEIFDGLINDTFALGLFAKPISDPRVTYYPIRDLPFVLIVPSNHYLALRETIDLRDIQDMPFILRDGASSLSQASRELFHSIGIQPNIANEASSNEIMAHLVAHGIGLGIGTDIPSLQAMDIVRIPISYPKHNNILYLGALRTRRMSVGEEHVFSFLTGRYSIS